MSIAKEPLTADALYDAFCLEHDKAAMYRHAMIVALKAHQAAYAAKLGAYYASRWREESRHAMSAPLAQRAAQQLTARERLDHARRIEAEAQDWAKVEADCQVPTWEGWLVVRAEAGNEIAAAILRRRREKRRKDALG